MLRLANNICTGQACTGKLPKFRRKMLIAEEGCPSKSSGSCKEIYSPAPMEEQIQMKYFTIWYLPPKQIYRLKRGPRQGTINPWPLILLWDGSHERQSDLAMGDSHSRYCMDLKKEMKHKKACVKLLGQLIMWIKQRQTETPEITENLQGPSVWEKANWRPFLHQACLKPSRSPLIFPSAT